MIEPINAGDDPATDWRKINEVIALLNMLLNMTVVPTDAAGSVQLDATKAVLNLTGFVTQREFQAYVAAHTAPTS
jgi:hypothetical protein